MWQLRGRLPLPCMHSSLAAQWRSCRRGCKWVSGCSQLLPHQQAQQKGRQRGQHQTLTAHLLPCWSPVGETPQPLP